MAKDKNVSTYIKNEVALHCASIDILVLVWVHVSNCVILFLTFFLNPVAAAP